MELKTLRYFKDVAEYGTIVGSARRLHISQSALSTMIKNLENELGCKLFDRQPRRTVLTDAGRILYNRAVQILAQVDSVTSELTDYQEGSRGTIKMGIVSSASNSLFIETLAHFRLFYPDIRYDLTESDTYSLLSKVRNGDLDLAIVRTPFSAPDLVKEPIFESRLACIGIPRSFPILKESMLSTEVSDKGMSGDISIKDLHGQPLILYKRWQSLLTNAFEENDVNPDIICMNDDARTTCEMVNCAMGIGIVPATALSYINPDVAAFNIIELPISSQVEIVYPKSVYLPKAAQKFVDYYTKNEDYLSNAD